jgi:hypothetical protein
MKALPPGPYAKAYPTLYFYVSKRMIEKYVPMQETGINRKKTPIYVR